MRDSMRSIAVLVFNEFELLDVFGPLEMFGLLPDDFELCLVAQDIGIVTSKQGPRVVADYCFNDARAYDILLVPGGMGTRSEIHNTLLLDWLRATSEKAQFVASVCTGSALLAKAGILDEKKATSNKRAFQWATAQSDKVQWQKQARWVEDGKFFTSSGISAGIDMSLALISNLLGIEVAEEVANSAEYEWHKNSEWDPFAS
jgi:putative intracellular protease/amidase